MAAEPVRRNQQARRLGSVPSFVAGGDCVMLARLGRETALWLARDHLTQPCRDLDGEREGKGPPQPSARIGDPKLKRILRV